MFGSPPAIDPSIVRDVVARGVLIQSERGVLIKSERPVLIAPNWGVLIGSEWGVLEKSDYPVLITPEYSSITMGNSRDDIKAQASYVTGTNLESGVAQAIYNYVLPYFGL